VRAYSVAILALGVWSARGCPTKTPPPAASAPCKAAAGTLAADARAEGLAGDYKLTLVATTGPRSGSSVSGRMRLVRYGANNPRATPRAGEPGANARYPIYGSADIPLDAVGAIAFGSIESMDAAAPGVLGIQWSSGPPSAPTPEITLRFGADANRADLLPFDGSHMALFVRALTSTGFAGRWTSSDGARETTGYFCAERVAERQ
jgi:hypothetical protein